MKNLLNFLFGKKPPIFNKQSLVEHQLHPQTWHQWNDKYQKGTEYDWHQHEGTRFSSNSSSNTK